MPHQAFRQDELITPSDESTAAFSLHGLRPLDMRPTYVYEYSLSGADTWSLDQRPRHLRIRFAEAHAGSFSSFSTAVRSINELLALPHGWDSYGGLPTSEQAARRAIAILARFAGVGGKMPAVVPVNNGGVQLEWHNSGLDVEIEIDKSGAVTAFVEGAAGPRVWANHQLPSDPNFVEALSTVLFPDAQ